MLIKLDKADRKEYERICEIYGMNNEMLTRYAAYVNNYPRVIDKGMIERLMQECGVSAKEAFCALLSQVLGLDSEENERDALLEELYIYPSVKMLDPASFTCDPYYKNIRIPSVKRKNWELKYESFAAYEGLVYDDLMIKGYHEFPRIGFFGEEFVFPAVLEKGREWMMITPNEINTMKAPLEKMKGRIVTFGLGMGYFAYMASLKEEVTEITVVEKDPAVIELFEEFILPQFENADKIKLVCADAFEYAEAQMEKECFDCAFTDIWRDASDGLDLYVKMKKFEDRSPRTRFEYWVETTILSTLRRMVLEQLEIAEEGSDASGCISGLDKVLEMLEDSYLKELAKDLKKI